MTLDRREAIRDRGRFMTPDERFLLDALDVCEAERDRAVELLRRLGVWHQSEDVKAFLASVSPEERNE